jgi:hypothetical protein
MRFFVAEPVPVALNLFPKLFRERVRDARQPLRVRLASAICRLCRDGAGHAMRRRQLRARGEPRTTTPRSSSRYAPHPPSSECSQITMSLLIGVPRCRLSATAADAVMDTGVASPRRRSRPQTPRARSSALGQADRAGPAQFRRAPPRDRSRDRTAAHVRGGRVPTVDPADLAIVEHPSRAAVTGVAVSIRSRDLCRCSR